MAAMPDYDPRIIEQFAERLYGKAMAFVAGSVVVGAMLGAAFGSVPLTSLGGHWPIPATFGFATMLLGGLVGAAIGYVVGDTRAFGYKLQAQSALCQLQIERNTSAAAAARSATASAPARTAAPAPKPAPADARPAPAPAPPRPVAPPPTSSPGVEPPPSIRPPVDPPPSVRPPAAAPVGAVRQPPVS